MNRLAPVPAVVAAASTSASSRARMLTVVVAGAYCWALTVVPQVTATGVASASGIFAGLGLVALLGAPILPPGRLALTFALDVFLSCCVLCWLFGTDSPMDPPFALFGSFGWLAYTLALGALSTPSQLDRPASAGARLEPRTRPSRLSAAALAACLVLSLLMVGAAWLVERPAMAVLSHVFALVIVLLLLRSGSQLATYLQVHRTKLEAAPRLGPAIWPLVTLFLLAVGGALWAALAR